MENALFRYFEVAEAPAEGTLRVAFSSETPVLRTGTGKDAPKGEKYWEVLDHTPEHCDIKLLNNRGAFIDEHKMDRQLGVIEKAEICPDRMGRADISFCDDQLSKDRSIQIRSKKRPHISFGYIHTRELSSEPGADGLPVKRFAWLAFEISSVAVPADSAVGVGRTFDGTVPPVDSPNSPTGANATPTPTITLMPENTPPTIDANAVRSEALKSFQTRAKEITAIADVLIADHGKKDDGKVEGQIRSAVSEALQTDASVDNFKVRCLEIVAKAKPAKPILMRDFASDKEMEAYSILRGIQSAISRDSNIPDGLEGEVHAEVMKRAKESGDTNLNAREGFQVPFDANMRASLAERRRMTRDMTAGAFASGGAFVPTLLQAPVIELLRNLSVLDKCGVRVMGGLTGNIVIPRQESAATAYAVTEIETLTASQQVLGQIALTPRRVGATENYSKTLIMQSSPDVEAFIRDDLFTVLALKWDYLGLNGDGAGKEPTGVINQAGVGSIIFGATPTYVKMVAMETAIRSANVNDDLVYLSTPSTKGALKTVAEALTGATTIGGSQNALWKPDNTVNGYRAIASNQIPGNKVILGAFNQLIQALWGGLDVVWNPYTKAKEAEIELTINTWGDYAVRHPQAFVVSADAGNQ